MNVSSFALMLNYLTACFIIIFMQGCKESDHSTITETRDHGKTVFFDLNISNVALRVEIAALPEERERGFMFREFIGEDEGMLFVFKEGSAQRFWMKNTRIPLDIGYISTSGELLEVHKAKPYDLSGVPSRSKDIKFVLELNAGAYKKLGIPIGTRIPLDDISNMLKHRGLNPEEFNLGAP